MSYQLSGNGMRPAYMGGRRRRTNDPFGSSGSMIKRQRNYALDRKVARTAARIINNRAEKKYHDVINSFVVSDTGFMVDLSAVPIGTSDVTRVGDKLTILGINFWFNMAITGTTGDFNNIIRVIIFQWHPDDGTTPPTQAQLLQVAAAGTISPYNHDLGTNFTVLRDIRTPLSYNGQTNTAFKIKFNPRRLAKRSRRPFRRTISYDVGSAFGMHKIYMHICSDSTTTVHPSVSFYSRMIYTDF